MTEQEAALLEGQVIKLELALTAAWHALESYAHDNASTELAACIAADCKATLDAVRAARAAQ